MKFTKEDAIKELKAQLKKDHLLSERTISDTVENLLGFAGEEMELSDFVTKVKRSLETFDGDKRAEIAKYEKAERERTSQIEAEKGKYIAVNHLPFIRRENLQINSLNVNPHIPDLPNGSPDYAQLEEMMMIIRPLFENVTINGAWFEIDQESQPISDVDQTHFKNLRLKIYHYGKKNGSSMGR